MTRYLDEDLDRRKRDGEEIATKLRNTQTQIKERLLAGEVIEPGPFRAELKLLPGRDPESKEPDDYDLIVSSNVQ